MNDVLRPTVDAVRRLALALALEPHGADDLAQEAWLDALRKGVDASELGRWLFGATRRIARSIRRDEARRRERERQAAKGEAVASTSVSAARMEVVGRVIAAVQELEEPQRTAIVLRFFEDLPPRALARRLGIPVNTARSRVRRGLDDLRARLDRDSLLVLAPFALGKESRLATGASPWTKLGMAAGFTAALLGGTYLLREPPEPVPDRPALAALDRMPGGAPLVPVVSQEGATAPQALARAGAARVERAPEATHPEKPSAAPAPEDVEVVGRFLTADGRPAAGVRPLLNQSLIYLSEAPSRESAYDGMGDSFLAVSDEAGRFRFLIRPIAHFGYELALEGAVTRSWPLPRLRSGERVDLGDIVLAEGATILGRLVDGAGNPLLLAGWKIQAEAEGSGSGETAAATAVDTLTGAYRLADLPGGRYRLSAEHPSGGRIEGPSVELAEGGTEVADLRYAGPDLARRIRLDVGCPGFDAQPEPEHVHLRCPDRRVLHPAGIDRSTGSFVFDDLAAGAYDLASDDPRFLPWSQDGVEPGSVTRAELVGSAALRFSVRDRRTGEPLELFGVRARRVVPRTLCPEYLWHRGDTALADGLLAGVVPDTYALTVSSADHGSETIEVQIAPGETRRVELALGPGEWVAGKVTRADGTPAGGCALVLFPAEAPILRALANVRSGPDGAFRLPLPSAGSFVLEVKAEPPLTPAPGVRFSVGEDENVEGLVLIVP